MTQPSEGEFIEHRACESCGSTDGLGVYTDHTFCFVCEQHTNTDETSTPRKSLTFNPYHGDPRAIPARNLTAETCSKFGYWIHTPDNEDKPALQVANYRTPEGELVAQKLRGPNKDFFVNGSLKEAGLFGQSVHPKTGKRIVVTEGEIDCLSVSQAFGNRWPVVSVPNGAAGARKAVKAAIDFLEGYKEVVFMFDMDEAGQEAAQECAMVLTPGRAKIATLPEGENDASDLLQHHNVEAIQRAVYDSKVQSPDELVLGDAIWDEVIFVDDRPGMDWIYPGVHDKLGNIKPGDLIVVAADTGVGKSEFLRPQAVSMIEAGAKVAYLALEETAQRTALGLMSIPLKRPVWDQDDPQEGVDPTEFRQAYEITAAKTVLWKNFGSTDVDNIVNRIRYAIKAADCTHVFLDHISIVVSEHDESLDERKLLDRLVTKLVSLAQETSTAIICVCHLSRPKDGKDSAPTSLGRLRGSHAIGQLAFAVIGLERDLQAEGIWENITKIRILKNRRRGRTGIAGYLKYHHETGLLESVEKPGEEKDSGFVPEETY